MTPEERARAEEITAAMERFSKDRRHGHTVSIPGLSPKAPAQAIRLVQQQPPQHATTGGHGMRYVLIFVLVLVLHGAAFMLYRHFTAAKEREINEAVALASMIEKNRQEAETAHLAALLKARQEQQQQQTTVKQFQSRPVVAQPPPKIEYNVYRDIPQTRNYTREVSAQQTHDAQSESFTKNDHAKFAVKQAEFYFNGEYAKKLGVKDTSVTDITVDSTTHDQNWNTYITEGRVNIRYYQTGSYQSFTRSEKYEITTHVREGQITLESSVRVK